MRNSSVSICVLGKGALWEEGLGVDPACLDFDKWIFNFGIDGLVQTQVAF